MLKRCQYCHKVFDAEEGTYFCSRECQEAYDAIARRDASHAGFLMFATVAAVIAMVAGALTGLRELTAVGCFLFGIAIIFCPFATPNMIQIFGYQRARVVVRVVGFVAILFGVWIGWLHV